MVVIFNIILIIPPFEVSGTIIILFTDEETETKIGYLTCPSSRSAFNCGRVWDQLTMKTHSALLKILKTIHINYSAAGRSGFWPETHTPLSSHLSSIPYHKKAPTHENTPACTSKLCHIPCKRTPQQFL